MIRELKETLMQSTFNIDELLKQATGPNAVNFEENSQREIKAYDQTRVSWRLGQWLDAQDRTNQWVEGQV